MGMQIEKSFVVKAPAPAVWDFLTDPRRVARCLPGAAITEQVDEKTWAGTITVKVGPVTANYRGTLRFERLDAAAGEAELAAAGQETRGKGGADMRMKSRVVERTAGETEVTVISDVNVVGVLAQFGRGMIQDVSDQLFARFADGMRRELEASHAPPGSAPPAAGAAVAPPAAAAPGPAAPAPSSPSSPSSLAPPPAQPAPAAAGTAAAADSAAAAATPRAAEPAPAEPGPPAGEPALDLGALGAAAAARAAGRTLRRPGFWIGVIVLAAVIYWFLVR
ncbi:MAG TPA: SRPBCC family protein [Thermoanaerobaculia bacterium]|nr:SRPBCC family protein [Thermoanaerobaculia bacterium]